MQGSGDTQGLQEGKARRPYAPRMTPPKRREQLLDATLEAILELGYGDVSIEAVARKAGVTRPVIYDHFPNLPALLRALIEREEQYALEQLDTVIPSAPSDDGDRPALPAGVRQLLQEIGQRPQTWRLILLPPAGTPAMVREQVEINRQRILERLEKLVWTGVEHWELPAELDVELAARNLRDMIEEAGRMVLTDPVRFSPERYERHLTSLLALIRNGAAES